MKARIIATEKIVEVDECRKIFKDMGWDYMDMRGRCYKSEDLDFSDNTPFDYWTRLEHQAAIAAMEGMCGNTKYNDYAFVDMAKLAIKAARTLVERMKNKEEM